MRKYNPWVKKGFFYQATLVLANGHGTVTRRLDFISYHLIRYFHGEDKLIDMAFKDLI